MKAPKKTSKWIVLAILIALGAAGGLAAWAAPPEEGNDGQKMAAKPADVNPVVAGTPVPTTRPIPRIAIDAELIGTAVIEGSSSVALFQVAGGTRMVREGDEIANGVRLVQVWRSRIEVELDGIRQEVRLGYSEGIREEVDPDSASGSAIGIDVKPGQAIARQKARLHREWLVRNRD